MKVPIEVINDDVVCQIRIKLSDGDDEEQTFTSLSEFTKLSTELKGKWIAGVANCILGSKASDEHLSVRPWDLVLYLDGTVESLAVCQDAKETSTVYPVYYRIPPTTIADLCPQERIRRQERFAFASLLYEILFGKKIFQELPADEVQQHFSNGEFPSDVKGIPIPLLMPMLSCWSREFAHLIDPPHSPAAHFVNGIKSYASAHPYLFALQAGGAVVAGTALAAPALLGAVGFGALGPVAGSVAAGWQSSIGAVQAGSLFAWCQSAAMGGAAAQGIFTAGVAGVGVAGGATAGALAGAKGTDMDVDEMMQKFKEVFRKEPKASMVEANLA